MNYAVAAQSVHEAVNAQLLSKLSDVFIHSRPWWNSSFIPITSNVSSESTIVAPNPPIQSTPLCETGFSSSYPHANLHPHVHDAWGIGEQCRMVPACVPNATLQRGSPNAY